MVGLYFKQHSAKRYL